MKFTLIALVSALAAVSIAEFCDGGATGVGACENIDKNTFCVSSDFLLLHLLVNTVLTSRWNSAWMIRQMRSLLSGTAWRILRARLVRAGHGQSAAEGFICNLEGLMLHSPYLLLSILLLCELHHRGSPHLVTKRNQSLHLV